MLPDDFLARLKAHTTSFANAVETNEGEWIIKGFIDIYRRIYTISVDTKITSKVLDLLLFPMFVEFAKINGLRIELSPHQNFYPDLTFVHDDSGCKFAVDIKSTYRTDDSNVNGMTLGAFTGYFQKRDSNKNTLYPYEQYSGHFVIGVIYSKCDDVIDERKVFKLDDLEQIPSVIKDFHFFAQSKYRLASWRPGSGNTKNIGSVTRIDQLIGGTGPFEKLGEEVYDDYWMFYLTGDMAKALEIVRPYTNLKSYLDYKQRGVDTLREHKEEIRSATTARKMEKMPDEHPSVGTPNQMPRNKDKTCWGYSPTRDRPGVYPVGRAILRFLCCGPQSAASEGVAERFK